MTVRPRMQEFADGSVVELTAIAEIAIDFTPEVRGVRLLQGEAHFAVAKDARRPFVVSAGPVKVRAVGTGFNVRFESAAIQILVTEGTVAVDPPTAGADSIALAPMGASTHVAKSSTKGPGASELILNAGYRTTIALASDLPLRSVGAAVSAPEIERELAWRAMRFELSNARLDEAVALFNRKGRMQLSIGDPELGGRRISGIYWADNPTQFAELIESTLEILALRQGADRIVFRRR